MANNHEPPSEELNEKLDDHTRIILLERRMDGRDAYEIAHLEVHEKLDTRDQWFYRGAGLALFLFSLNLLVLLVNR